MDFRFRLFLHAAAQLDFFRLSHFATADNNLTASSINVIFLRSRDAEKQHERGNISIEISIFLNKRDVIK